MRRVELDAYLRLLETFQSGRISAEDFETDYLALFKSDNRLFPENVFRILNQLFSDVDMFVSNPEIRGLRDLDHSQLLECSRKAFEALANLLDDA